MYYYVKRPFDFATKKAVWYFGFLNLTYMRVSNFGQNFDSKKSLPL